MYKVIIYFSDKDNDNQEFTNWFIKDFDNKDEANAYYEKAKGCVWFDYKEIVRVEKDY